MMISRFEMKDNLVFQLESGDRKDQHLSLTDTRLTSVTLGRVSFSMLFTLQVISEGPSTMGKQSPLLILAT